MIRLTGMIAFLTLFLPIAGGAAEDEGASLAVRVNAIDGQRKGEVGIALFENKKGYPTHIEHAYEPAWIPVQTGVESAEHTFEGLPAGDYAVSVLHDENGNRKMERSTFGFPKEGVGFSNDQKVKLSAPDYEDCQFLLSEGEHQSIAITLDYRDN
jgi:uncharacterized protein (DUF2141 family)